MRAEGGGRRLIGQILKDRAALREGPLQEALGEQRKSGGLIGQHLVALGHVSPAELVGALAQQAGLDSVDDAQLSPTEDALRLVDATTAHTFGVLPLEVRADTLVVALADPLNTSVCEDLRFSTGLEVRAVIASPDALRRKVLEVYGEETSLADLVREAARSSASEDAESAAQSAPVVRLVGSILHRAIRDRASDIHFEVFAEELRIRYRVDGALYEVEAPPAHLAAALVARIKVLSDLDIAETKFPQDGRIALAIDGRPVDLRVATLPGIDGEGCVLRVLDRSAVALELGALGLSDEEAARLRELVSLPHGIILMTGPTGSGKTTSLYAMLGEANDESVKILTAEDPVEYDIDGIVQVPIQPDIGVGYPQVLRTMLRHDPDKILVGEIRDVETAGVAVEASLTGHTVFATVHTQDAPSAVTRLVDMGVEPFLISATLEAVVAQRLVRKVCPDCAEAYPVDETLLRELGPSGRFLEGREVYRGRGCGSCFHTGYRGRTAIFEIMRVDDAIRGAVTARRSGDEIRQHAMRAGMRGLRESGLVAVARGLTTLDEVLRETLDA